MHIIYIIVDGLRQDVLQRMYDQKKLNGGLKFLMEKGIVCENVYANGCPTQFSAPSIFTSTLPLDYGGYDTGIANRPVSFVEILQKRGYETIGVATGPWESSVFGYDRGFTTFYHTFDLNEFIRPIINEIYLNYYKSLLSDKWTRAEITKLQKKFITFCLPFIRKEITKRLNDVDPKWIYPTEYLYDDLQHYLHELDIFEKKLHSKNFDIFNDTFPLVQGKKRHASLFKRTGMTLANRFIPEVIRTREEFFPTLYAKELLDQFYTFFLEGADKRPQFQYMHLLELHELKYTDAPLQIYKNPFAPLTCTYIDPNMCSYEKAVEFIDQKLGDYFSKLFSTNQRDNISIIVSGDHGFHDGYPNRKSLGQAESHLCDIYHESLDCALLLYSPKVKPFRYTEHCSLIDLSPSILELVGIPQDKRLKGQSIFHARKDTVVISESCGRGPCHLPSKPIYLSIKKPPYKMIYREFFHPGERIRNKKELYHLDDRYDQKDIISEKKYLPITAELEKIAESRIREIRKFVSH